MLDQAYNFLHEALISLSNWGMILLEAMGVIILLISGVRAFIAYWRKEKDARLKLAQNMATALEFKLGGEILRTVVVRDWSDLLQVGVIILLRAALSILIQWEISTEEGASRKNMLTPWYKGDGKSQNQASANTPENEDN